MNSCLGCHKQLITYATADNYLYMPEFFHSYGSDTNPKVCDILINSFKWEIKNRYEWVARAESEMRNKQEEAF